jgi:hypothetical protein
MPISRSLLVPLLRAAGAGLTMTPDAAATKAAYDEGVKAGIEIAKSNDARWQENYENLKRRAD